MKGAKHKDKKIILAVGGAVIKTARNELIESIKLDRIKVLIHNGGSIFHDFQKVTDLNLVGHSYPLDDLIKDYSCNKLASRYVWDWIRGYRAPQGSATWLCEQSGVKVLLFTGLGCDFWHLFDNNWADIARKAESDFRSLCSEMKEPFHYICMGSAVIHPEVFIKAIAVSKPTNFRADVVDFKEAWRPRTRVARYGHYYMMRHKKFLQKYMIPGRIQK